MDEQVRDRRDRGRTVARLLVGLTALASVEVGLWALLAPSSFYRSFPGGGHSWVAVDGPYNQHLVRDVGELNLALAVLGLTAAVLGTTVLIRLAAACFLVSGVPHLIYHATHLENYEGFDRIGNLAALSVGVVLPALALALTLVRAGSEHRRAATAGP